MNQPTVTRERERKRQLTAGSLPLFLNLEMRSSVTFFVGMVAVTHCRRVLLSQILGGLTFFFFFFST